MNVFSRHSDQIKANRAQTQIFAPPAEPERSHLDVALYRLHARLPSSPPSTLSSRPRTPSTSNLSPNIPLFAAESIAVAPPAEDPADARGAGGPTFKGAMQRVRPHADLSHQPGVKGVVPLISSLRGRFGLYVSVVYYYMLIYVTLLCKAMTKLLRPVLRTPPAPQLHMQMSGVLKTHLIPFFLCYLSRREGNTEMLDLFYKP